MGKRIADDFERFYEEERQSSRPPWADMSEQAEKCLHISYEGFVREEEERTEDWSSALTQAVVKAMDTVEVRLRKNSRLNALEARIRELEAKLAEAVTRECLVVPIISFVPEPFECLKEIKVVVQQVDDEEFTATFFEANVNAGGCHQQEAVANLKNLLLRRLEFLSAQPPEKLGKPLKKQLAVLQEFIRRKE